METIINTKIFDKYRNLYLFRKEIHSEYQKKIKVPCMPPTNSVNSKNVEGIYKYSEIEEDLKNLMQDLKLSNIDSHLINTT